MSKYALNLKGHKYGRLEVVRRVTNSKSGAARWLCQCECGNLSIVISANLRQGLTQSCGCLRNELSSKRTTTHGLKHDPLYKLWRNVKDRTTNPNNPKYQHYGGRGIKMHPKWLEDVESFIKYILNALGPKPSPKHTLDRIDNDEDYVPGNLRWATASQQLKNRRPRNQWTRSQNG